MTEAEDPDVVSRRIAKESLDQDDPTGWFEQLYSAASEGAAVVPWDRGTAHPLLSEWVDEAQPDGSGKTALIVGAGTGWDAELVADLGYQTTAFDISASAIETAHRNHPDSKAQYVVADLFNPPAEWHRAFDLVVEIYTVQALPISLQPAAIKQITEQVGPGGTLLVIAVARPDDEPDEEVEGPPWPLTRAALDSFTTPDLHLIQLIQSPSPVDPTINRWRAEYLRD
ncbi:thiopurine S-methyltransferase [Kribbella antiqua]|uniref:Thiopurine S-methyltransferase n=1 Tax=Kribbella antiqua TaxID=2512217 RepID=A0A4R2IZX3_9ACTN|nr:class I SAM-dependent methyltransferase [Kribbella antiqua]TCO51234.1 thiopurine S-methyltransferase [Kribbella antiqua]